MLLNGGCGYEVLNPFWRTASAGFKPEQISVTVHQNTLTIAGRTNEKQGEAEYLYRGIAGRPFERRFNLADYVEVKRASFEDGLLQIELEREVPESMKPRKIEVQLGISSPATRRRRSSTVRWRNRSSEVVRVLGGPNHFAFRPKPEERVRGGLPGTERDAS